MSQLEKREVELLNKEFAQGAELLAQGIEQMNTVLETLMEETHQEELEPQVVEQSNSVIGIIIESIRPQEELQLASQGGQLLNNTEEMQV